MCATRCCTCCNIPLASCLKDAAKFKAELESSGAFKQIGGGGGGGGAAAPVSEQMG